MPDKMGEAGGEGRECGRVYRKDVRGRPGHCASGFLSLADGYVVPDITFEKQTGERIQ